MACSVERKATVKQATEGAGEMESPSTIAWEVQLLLTLALLSIVSQPLSVSFTCLLWVTLLPWRNRSARPSFSLPENDSHEVAEPRMECACCSVLLLWNNKPAAQTQEPRTASVKADTCMHACTHACPVPFQTLQCPVRSSCCVPLRQPQYSWPGPMPYSLLGSQKRRKDSEAALDDGPV